MHCELSATNLFGEEAKNISKQIATRPRMFMGVAFICVSHPGKEVGLGEDPTMFLGYLDSWAGESLIGRGCVG